MLQSANIAVANDHYRSYPDKHALRFFAIFMMMVMISTAILQLSSLSAFAAGEPKKLEPDPGSAVSVGASGMVVMDSELGNVLYDKNADEKYYPASTTKVMTALIVLENNKDLDKETTVSDAAVNGIDPTSSHIALDVGEKISIRDLLYGLLLSSGNDCAVALAEETSGSVKEFAKLMNAKADELGLKNTHFVNPHGLFDKKHYTTPHDLATIMRACLKNKEFVKIFSTLKHVVPKTNKSDKRELWNNHRMVKGKYQYYKGVVGGKTGYITESRFNLITYAKRSDLGLIVVGMRSDGQSEIVDDTKKVLDRYFKKYKIETLKKKDIPRATVTIDGKKIKTKAKGDIRMLLPKDVNVKGVSTVAKPYDETRLPVSKGQVIGKTTAIYSNTVLGSTAITSTQDVMSRTQEIMRIAAAVFAGVALLAIVIAIIVRSKKKKRKMIFSK